MCVAWAAAARLAAAGSAVPSALVPTGWNLEAAPRRIVNGIPLSEATSATPRRRFRGWAGFGKSLPVSSPSTITSGPWTPLCVAAAWSLQVHLRSKEGRKNQILPVGWLGVTTEGLGKPLANRHRAGSGDFLPASPLSPVCPVQFWTSSCTTTLFTITTNQEITGADGDHGAGRAA